jgi:hypothetical protein
MKYPLAFLIPLLLAPFTAHPVAKLLKHVGCADLSS